MAGVNRVFVLGRAGRDGELSYTPAGMPRLAFSLAVNSSRKAKDGTREDHTEWVDCVAWDSLAETVAGMVVKGREVFVEGRLATRKWEGKDGSKHSRTEVVASSVQVLGSREDGGGRKRQDVDSDLPFD